MFGGVLLGVFGGACGLVIWGRLLGGEADRLEHALQREQATWHALATAPVAPTAENVAAARAHRGELELLVARLQDGLTAGAGWAPVPEFGGSEDLYFDLVSMVERQRREYTAAGIGFGEGEQFGYGQIVYDQQVRLPKGISSLERRRLLVRLHRQRQALEAALVALREAGPEEVRAVERTAVLAPADERVGVPEDIFRVDPMVTAEVTGILETTGVRLVFVGQTKVLRDFLGSVQAAPRPLLVRSVEVRPAEEPGRAPGGRIHAASPFVAFAGPREEAARADGLASPARPIVAANRSVFTVVVEGFAILEGTGAKAARGEEAPS
ncbi:MAG: hypothetical protein ACLFU2_05065 [Opitutales bacterium]